MQNSNSNLLLNFSHCLHAIMKLYITREHFSLAFHYWRHMWTENRLTVGLSSVRSSDRHLMAISLERYLSMAHDGWGCKVSCGGHHRLRGKTTTGSALDGAVFDKGLPYIPRVHLSEGSLALWSGYVLKNLWSEGPLFRSSSTPKAVMFRRFHIPKGPPLYGFYVTKIL